MTVTGTEAASGGGDTWKRTFSADKEGRKISEELNGLGMNWDAKMVSRINLD